MKYAYRSRLREINEQSESPMTQQEIADTIGVSRQSINRWMNSKAFERPDMQIAGQLANLFGRKPFDILEVIEIIEEDTETHILGLTSPLATA